ncbi:MAG TPA: MATE family efflux transporter, partial [Myxococcota bacterium]|nr:MATE family efflux transporter [Myxococcota bacterium]
MTPASRPHRAEAAALLRAAWPVIVGQLGMMTLNTVDTVMVGRYGGEALAAVTLANTWSFAWLIVGIGGGSGLDPALAQAWGARDDAGYDRAVVRGLALLLALSVPIALSQLFTAPALLLAGQPPELVPLARSYALALAPSTPAILAWFLLKQALQGRSRGRLVMWTTVFGNVVNVAANVLLMEGIGSWPGLGPTGSGVATSVVRYAMLAV